MEKRILFINPIASSSYDDEIREYLKAGKCQDTIIKVVSLERGPLHLDYHYYETLALTDILHLVKQAEEEGYDGAIIGCFLDSALEAAREITHRLVVAAPAESCMLIAASLGHSFSIIVTKDKALTRIRDNVVKYGFKDRLALFKSVALGVRDLQEDRTEAATRIKELAKEAVERDLAEVIILGCTIQFGFYKELQQDVGVPVLDAILATLKYAELMIELKKRFNWGQSKAYSYESPPRDEIIDWKLEEQYGVKGIWS